MPVHLYCCSVYLRCYIYLYIIYACINTGAHVKGSVMASELSREVRDRLPKAAMRTRLLKDILIVMSKLLRSGEVEQRYILEMDR